MQFGASFRQRSSFELNPERVRRAQMGFWLIVLLLAIAIFLQTSTLQVANILGLTNMSVTEATDFRANLASLGLSARSLAIVVAGGRSCKMF